MNQIKGRRIRRRGDEVGLFAAAASAPRSFQSSLMERSTADQGIVTGVTMALAFLIGALAQDAIDSATDSVVNARIDSGRLSARQADKKRVQYSAIASLSAVCLGIAGKKMFAQKSNERALRSTARTASHWVVQTGFSGLAVSVLEFAADMLDGKAGRIRQKARVDDRSLWPFIIPVGVLISVINELSTKRNGVRSQHSRTVRPMRAIGIGAAVATVLSAVALAEKFVASKIDDTLQKHRPEVRALRLPVGHAIGFGVLGFGLYKAAQSVMHKAETNGVGIEKGYAKAPGTQLVSGSEQSFISWDSLSLQGRRFIGSILTKNDINHIMNTSQALDPIRIFVGLESAPTEEERVQLAMFELRRTGAFDRDTLVVIQPTGTGYINYIMAESVEFLSRGNCALVGMQYSLRPSPLSLDRVNVGIAQHRMLLQAIKRELLDRPARKRPRVLLFGESLGAWTSQDAFMHQGTDGFEALRIDGALWIGTPAESTWHTQVLDVRRRLDTDYDSIGCFNDFGQVERLRATQRQALRFVLLTNDNDPIAKFGPKLLIQEPEWLKPGQPRPATVPANIRWRTPSTFIQLLVDMKNALKPTPGVFVADGHDYRASLPEFVNFAYRFEASDKELAHMRKALIANEIARSKREAL